MNAFLTYLWPAIAAGVVLGIIAGSLAWRVKVLRPDDHPHEPELIHQPRRKQVVRIASGVAVAISAAIIWHGPLGAADRFAGVVERSARSALVYNQVPEVSARLHRGPLTRRLTLSGHADDFQRDELVRLLSQLPGVSRATWDGDSLGLPLLAEGIMAALAGFLLGLLLAYLVELRRRYNSQWKW